MKSQMSSKVINIRVVLDNGEYANHNIVVPHVDYIAWLQGTNEGTDSPRRREFAHHVRKVVQAIHPHAAFEAYHLLVWVVGSEI